MNVFTIRLSLVIKLSLSFGVCIFLSLLVAGYAFINTENKLVNDLITNLKIETQQLQQVEEDQQVIKLDENIQFNADMLGAISAVKIYSIDDVGPTIIPFFRIPEIQAIIVLDDQKTIYAAYWRQNESTFSGTRLPPSFSLESFKVAQGIASYREREVGVINIYYTDRLLKQHFQRSNVEALKNFEKSSSKIKEINQKNKVHLWVVLGVIITLCSVLVLITMKVMMSPIITYPLAQMTEATERIARGDFDVKLEEKRVDEVGRLGKAINHMASRLSSFVTGQKRFLGDVAHELASPIARTQLALSILETKTLEHNRQYVDDAIEEMDHMSDIVNSLLSFSRAEIVPGSINFTKINLLSLVKKVVAREKAHYADIRVEVHPDITANGDEELLFRAFSNILRNALRYAKGYGAIAITAKSVERKVCIEFSDSGTGVPEEMIDQLFDPFYRVEKSRERDTGGVGLGLSIVKSCIEACKGNVAVRNVEPKGFCVSVELDGLKTPVIATAD
ncbi:sensor histidine kinase [Desulfosediminicola ganghwensis]|uniref:sensor histidine kinase n=1 Tax=Desulfosediminicola ganghwensis TaxID=2569540 RepID=UPI0010AB9C12|nr:HAMP domain-containing sensor histidine kinase [Desulfosediminicola ganghwensis]